MKTNRMVLRILIAVGVASSLYYFSWWLDRGRFENFFLLALLLGMGVYLTAQAFFVWYIYLHARKKEPVAPSAKENLSIDVFLPTYHEPLPLIENTLRAVVNIRYPHTTYVIDDGGCDKVRALAVSLGAKYIRRHRPLNYKAGNINNALKESSGDLIAVFDIDHVPQPDFLEKVVPAFRDPRIGVVQVALDHSNQGESFVSAAAGRMSDEFFAATMRGMDSLGCAVVFGSNSVFRRSALLSLGGYRPGLAEDLSTSVHLHAAGWKSAYIPSILAKGLVPSDLEAFYNQQYKWARGVFDVLLNEFGTVFRALTGKQRICYATRMTYYLSGPVVGIHTFIAMLAPFIPGSVASVGEYFLKSVPVVLTFIAIHIHAYRSFALKPVGTPVDIRGAMLVLASWPVYTLAFFTALLRTPARFVSTPKSHSRKRPLRLIVPQLVTVFFLVVSLSTVIQPGSPFVWPYAAFATILILLHLAILPAAVIRRNRWEAMISRN